MGTDRHANSLSLFQFYNVVLPCSCITVVVSYYSLLCIQITMMEHTLSSCDVRSGSWKTCDSYYSNTGPVRKRVSSSAMTTKSAKRAHNKEDHMTKAERRQLKKIKRAGELMV